MKEAEDVFRESRDCFCDDSSKFESEYGPAKLAWLLFN